MPAPAVILGVPIDDVTLDEAVDEVFALIRRGRRWATTQQVTTVNVDFLSSAHADPAILATLRSADLSIPDGMPLVWASRLLGSRLRERVAGADLVPAVAERAAREGARLFLFGSAPGVAERTAEILADRYRGLAVAGVSGPQMRDVADVDDAVLAEIAAFDPDVVCVALGHPKQERFIEVHRERLGAPVMIGVGGTFDFICGEKRRAPRVLQRAGLEWLHRLATEPRRLWRRYSNDFRFFLPRIAEQLAAVPAERRRPPLTFRTERYGDAAVLTLESDAVGTPFVIDALETTVGRCSSVVLRFAPGAEASNATVATMHLLRKRLRDRGAVVELPSGVPVRARPAAVGAAPAGGAALVRGPAEDIGSIAGTVNLRHM